MDVNLLFSYVCVAIINFRNYYDFLFNLEGCLNPENTNSIKEIFYITNSNTKRPGKS